MVKKLTPLSLIFLLSFLMTLHAERPTALIVTGEPSGEELAAWYVKKTNLRSTHDITLVGSEILSQQLRVSRLPGFDDLKNMTILGGLGALSQALITKHFLFRRFVEKIIQLAPSRLILIDFPFVNLRLARAIKKELPQTLITYIAPPELWFWGCWGIDTYLRNYCNECIVLYPHEQAWYTEHHITTQWYGYPYEQAFLPFLTSTPHPAAELALLPGSRPLEVKKTLPLMCAALKNCTTRSQFHVLIAQADAIPDRLILDIIQAHGLENQITLIKQSERTRLSRCFYALTKPGTITLHLALLGVPHAVILKNSWLNAAVLKYLIKPKAFGLPNLLSSTEVSDEFIQEKATPEVLSAHLDKIFLAFQNQTDFYTLRRHQINVFRQAFLNRDQTSN